MKNVTSVRAKYLRLNLETKSTQLFEEVNEVDRKKILEKVELLENEVIIISFIKDFNYWWVITNLRLIVLENNSIDYFDFQNIAKVKLNEIFNGNKEKQECMNIDFVYQDNTLKIEVEENTWHGVFNILKFMIN